MGRPIKKSRMLADFNPGATATLAVTSYFPVGGSATDGTGSYIVKQRGSKQFKVHLNDSTETTMTLKAVAKASLVAGEFNVQVILDDSTVAYVEKFYNRTIHYVTAAGVTGTVPYTLATSESADEGQVANKGNIDIRTH